MDKVTLAPDEEGYGFADGIEYLRVLLDGGQGKYGPEVRNAAMRLTVQWTCDAANYEYLRGVYAQHVLEGHAPFPIDLFIDTLDFVEHQVRIVPGTFGLLSHSGLSFVVGCTLEVQPQRRQSIILPLDKLTLPPSSVGYTFTDVAQAVLVDLEGGLGRVRRDQLGVSNLVTVQWICNPTTFMYMRNFYMDWTTVPQETFPVDLVIDTATLVEYNARFLPGSMRVSSVRGHRVVISAQLETEVAPAAACDCSATAWQINFDSAHGEIVYNSEIGAHVMPMLYGTGYLSTTYPDLALSEDEPLYGDRSMLLGGTTTDLLEFINPAVTVGNNWTIRWSMQVPDWVFGEPATDIVLFGAYDNSDAFVMQVELHHISDTELPQQYTLRVYYGDSETPNEITPLVAGDEHHFELSLESGEGGYFLRAFIDGSLIFEVEPETIGAGLGFINWFDGNLNGTAIKFDEMRVTNITEHQESYALALPFCLCPPPGTPWLYFPTEEMEGDDSLAPIHKRTFEYFPITGSPEPFSYGVGATDDFGDGNNTYSVGDVVIPLYGTSGLPEEGQYTWEPADPEDTIVPVFSESNPSGGEWVGPNLFVSLSAGGGALIGWGGGVLTLYAGNSIETGSAQITIITFLPSSFVYPPVSVYYGPLS